MIQIDTIFCTNQIFLKTGIFTFDHFPICIIYQNVFQNVSRIETVNNLIDKLHNISYDDIIQSNVLDTSIKKNLMI